MPTASAAPGERLPRQQTLRRGADYQRCYRGGRRRHGILVTLHFHPNDEGHPRLGITVSRKVGSSVVRQRLKRWTREVFRRSPRRAALAPLDLIVHFKPGAGEADFASFRAELERLLAGAPAGAA
ncbi:MAG: ribonuclease P protein component [Thermoanaerobaculia bacterium]|nr:MAG: ribonuclease P protein component [Thermoanaerobaculia bacterium]MBZ0102310.1 ribonuclease P protein component [Thermoanaerobaculia bacterium]